MEVIINPEQFDEVIDLINDARTCNETSTDKCGVVVYNSGAEQGNGNGTKNLAVVRYEKRTCKRLIN